MPRKRQTKVGRVNPMDVRSKSDVGAFENLLGRGPLTIVLVYADWCGHCQTFKQDMWNEVSSMPNKKLNTASVHYDMVDKTSMKNAKIDGYPSLLLVGTDKKPASFETDEGKTNAMPTPNSVTELKNMVNTPVTTPVQNANTMAVTVVNNAKSNTQNVSSIESPNTLTNNTIASVPNTVKSVNTYEPANADVISVPNTSLDVVKNTTLMPQTETKNVKVGGGQRGGNEGLLAALTRITAEAGHAGALLLAATEYSDMSKRMTRRMKRRSKKTAKRRSKK